MPRDGLMTDLSRAARTLQEELVGWLPPDGKMGGGVSPSIIQEKSCVYVVRCTVTGVVKIGMAWHVPMRMRDLQSNCATPLEILAVATGVRAEEQYLHARYAPFRTHGEWFALPAGALVDLLALLSEGHAPRCNPASRLGSSPGVAA